jgi:putative phage-type endonuclease
MAKTIDLLQGSPDWHKFRSAHFGASEAAAMLGLSPYKTRDDLLKEKATGIIPDVSASVQRVFDKGHAVEALARPIVEHFIKDDLYPVTLEDGLLSCSCDGLTLDEEMAWECKQYNATLFESVKNGVLPEHHWPQCQQVLMLSSADKLIFTCSDGTPANTISMDVLPDPKKFEQLILGWAQFESDLKNYAPVLHQEAPKAEEIMQLPSINVVVAGGLTSSNLPSVTIKFDEFLANANTALVTDEDFANGEATARFSRDTAKKLKLTRQQIIDQVADISEATRVIDLYAAKFDALGLQLEKLVKSEKESIKSRIIIDAKADFNAFVGDLSKEALPVQLDKNYPNFAEAMKNKRTISSLHDAVNTCLSNAKIELRGIVGKLKLNLVFIEQHKAHMFLFNDLQQIAYKNFDDFKLVVESRIAAHEASEKQKADALREKIRAEEVERARINAENERIKAEQEALAIKAEEDAKAKAELDAIDAENARIKAEFTRAELREAANVSCDELAQIYEPLYAPDAEEIAHMRILDAESTVTLMKNNPPPLSDMVDILADHYRINEAEMMQFLITAVTHRDLIKKINDIPDDAPLSAILKLLSAMKPIEKTELRVFLYLKQDAIKRNLKIMKTEQ